MRGNAYRQRFFAMPTSGRRATRSVKVPTRGFQRAEQRAVIGEAAGDQMQHITVAFEYAVHTEQTRTQQFAALAVGGYLAFPWALRVAQHEACIARGQITDC